MRHLLSIDDLTREEIEAILDRAESFAEVGDAQEVRGGGGRLGGRRRLGGLVVRHRVGHLATTMSPSTTPSSLTSTISSRRVGRFLPT